MSYAEIRYDDINLDVEFTYYPGHPGHYPTMNDPGEPPTPPEFEFINITGGGRSLHEYTKTELDEIEQIVLDQVQNDF